MGAVIVKLGFGILHRVVGSCSQNKHSASLSSGKGGSEHEGIPTILQLLFGEPP